MNLRAVTMSPVASKKAVLVCGFIAIFLIILSFNQKPIKTSEDEVSFLPKNSRDDGLIYLLFWNSYLDSYASWGMSTDTSTREDLKKISCPVTNCIFTSKRDLLPSVTDFDVLFINAHGAIKFPEIRNSEQYYVLSTVE